MKRKIMLISVLLLAAVCSGVFAGGEKETVRAQDSKELVFWHSYTQQERIDAIDTTIDAFQESHPGVTVRPEVVPWGSFYEKWVSGMEADTLPDMSTALLNQALLMADAGATQPVDTVLDELGGPQAFLKQTIENLNYKGRYIGVPHYAHARLLWYRKDWLDEAGLQPPKSWDELRAAAERLNDPPGRYGFVMPFGDNGPGDIYFYHFILSNGGKIFEEDGTARIATPEVKEAVSFMLDLYRNASPQGSSAYDTRESKTAFISGRSAFIIEAPFIITDIMRDADWASPQTLAGIPFPEKRGPAWMSELISLVMMDGTEYPDETAAFLRFMFTEEQYVPFLHTIPGGQLPTIASIASGGAFFEHPVIGDYRESIEHAIRGIESGTPVAMSEGVNPWAAVVDGEEILIKVLQDVATGKKTIDQALADTEARLNRIVAEHR